MKHLTTLQANNGSRTCSLDCHVVLNDCMPILDAFVETKFCHWRIYSKEKVLPHLEISEMY